MFHRLLKALSLTILVICSCAGYAQDVDRPLTNDDVIQMVKSKQAPDTIVLIISRSKTDFNTSTNALIELSKDGVPKSILDAMLTAKSQERSQDEINFRLNQNFVCRDHTVWKADGHLQDRCGNLGTLAVKVYLPTDGYPPTYNGSPDWYDANRFLNCVSNAMAAEAGQRATLFDTEEALITFHRLLATPLISGSRLNEGINNVCRNLLRYSAEIKRLAEAADKAHQKLPKDFERATWHSVQVEAMHELYPSADAEKAVAEEEHQFCLFGSHC